MPVSLGNLHATWSATGSSNTAWGMHVTDLGAAADSKVIDITRNSQNVFSVLANGDMHLSGNVRFSGTGQLWIEKSLTASKVADITESGYYWNYTGTGGHTFTLGAASSFPNMYTIKITNNGTNVGLQVFPAGYTRKNGAGSDVTYFYIWPRTTAVITNVDGVWNVEYNYRWQTLDYLYVYVDHVTGSNDNDGLSTARPYATIQYAINFLEAEIDSLLHGATIQLAAETFTENGVTTTKKITGNHVIVINGDVSTPSNVIWQCSSGQTCFTARDWSGAILRGMRVQQAAGGSGAQLINVSQHGIIDIGAKFEFGNCAGGYHITSVNGGSLGYEYGANVAITGTHYASHWYVSTESNILCSGIEKYSVNVATFNSFLSMEGGSVTLSGFNFSGPGADAGSSGARYSVAGAYDLVGFWNGAGVGVRLPGSTPGYEYHYPQASAAGAVSSLGVGGYEFSGLYLQAGGFINFGNSSTAAQLYNTGYSLVMLAGSFGYGPGTGGTVSQSGSKSSGVSLDKQSGSITTHNQTLSAANNAGDNASFKLTNAYIEATDTLILNHVSGGTLGAYVLNARCAAGSANVNIRNMTSSALSDALVIKYSLLKGSST